MEVFTIHNIFILFTKSIVLLGRLFIKLNAYTSYGWIQTVLEPTRQTQLLKCCDMYKKSKSVWLLFTNCKDTYTSATQHNLNIFPIDSSMPNVDRGECHIVTQYVLMKITRKRCIYIIPKMCR